jgi:capsular exopolysaccharide synthesis family protein
MSELSSKAVVTPPRPFGASTPVAPLGGPPVWPRAPRSAPAENDRISFRDIRAMLRRRRALILAVCAVTTGIAAVVLLRQPPRYRAAALLRVSDVRRAVTSGIEDPSEVEGGRLINPVLSRIQLLRSRGLLGQVVDSVGLRLRPDFRTFPPALLTSVDVAPTAPVDTVHLQFSDNGVIARSRQGEGRAPYGTPVRVGDGASFTIAARPGGREATWIIWPREKAVDLLLETLRIAPRTQTDVVEVSYESRRPATAQAVVNAAAQLLYDVSGRGAQQQSRRRRIYLEEQLTTTDSLLADAQLALSRFRSGSRLVSSAEKLSAQQRDLMTLDSRFAELEASLRMIESMIQQRTRANSGAAKDRALRALVASPELTASPAIAQLYRQLVQYQLARDSLTTGAWGTADSNPDVRRLSELIASTEQRLVEVVRSHAASLEARIASVRELRDRSAASLESLPSVAAEDFRLQQRVETLRRLGDGLREDYQKARMAEAAEVGQVEVIDLAALPYKPVAALRGLKLGIALLIGLLLGVVIAWLRERTDTTILRREELDALALPTLSVIPSLGHGSAWSSNGSRRRWPALWRGTPARVERVNGSASSAELVALARRHSPGMEAYRALRTNLLFSPHGARMTTIVITSTAPEEGKTVSAANLAAIYARENRRVLLVDCDLWRARLHTVFGVAREPGLTEVLQERCDAADAVRGTCLPGLFLLPSGARHENPADLLTGEALRRLLGRLSDEFDTVIIDTPPVLALTDAAILGSAAAAGRGGVLLVIRAGWTDRLAVEQALRQLDGAGAYVVGAVLNDPDGEAMRTDRYYYASDYYAVRP